uniref:Probable cubilin (inferred by orthology to a C. elegans protein) n=1 Tax=Strongyloides venezuelensis TaxID=75913 RepID=A0A0K0FAF1_STRVS
MRKKRVNFGIILIFLACIIPATQDQLSDINDIFDDGERMSRIIMVDGNMAFHAGISKNISFHVSKDSGIFFQNTDITSLPNKSEIYNLTEKWRQTLDAVYLIRRSVIANQFSMTNIKTKMLRLDGAIKNLTITTGNISLSNNNKQRQMKRIARMLSVFQTNLHELLKVLKTDRCTGNPCLNGGQCFNTYIGYHCLCSDTWTGVNCEVDVNECIIYEGTSRGCQNGGKCVNKENGFYCECKESYHGELCQTKKSSCDNSKEICGEHGHCIPLNEPKIPNGPEYICLCPYGYKNHNDTNNPYCEDIDECQNNPCYPGATCVNLPGSFKCTNCPKGTQGNGMVCLDVDECLDERLNDCSKNPQVKCINTYGSYKCDECPAGYSGDGFTCKKISKCDENPCPINSTCTEVTEAKDGYICTCTNGKSFDKGFTTTCDEIYFGNKCFDETCENGGTCYSNGWYSTSCICPFGYGGSRCQYTTSCLEHNCYNRGNCITNGRDGVCECYPGYYGSECQFEDTFLGCNIEIGNQTGSLSLGRLIFWDEQIGIDHCSWNIKIPGSNNVTVVEIKTFANNDSISNHEDQRYECDIENSAIIIKDGITKNAPIVANFCKEPNGTLVPVINRQIIFSGSRFKIEFTPLLKNTVSDFFVNWFTIPRRCGGVLKNSFGEIDFKQDINMTHCVWYIEVNADHHIEIEIDRVSMITQKRVNCTVNNLKIYDGNRITGDQKISEVCSNENEKILISTTGPYATIYWSNDNQKDIYDKDDCISEKECNFGFKLSYKIIELPSGCGGEILPNENGLFEGFIQSPNYPNNYFKNLDCLWILNSTGSPLSYLLDHVIKLDIIDFDIPVKKDDTLCLGNHLKISSGLDYTYSNYYCNNYKPANSYAYPGEAISIKFHSDSNNNGKGFLIAYKSTCEKHFYTQNGTIQSVNYPNSSPYPINCTYIIYGPPTKGIKIKVIDFNLKQPMNICYGTPQVIESVQDYVKFSGPHSTNKLFNKKHVCKRHPLIPVDGELITSSTRPLTINYVSSGSPDNRGFHFEYEIFELGCGGVFDSSNGTITSPNYPDGYLENLYCVYKILVEDDKLVRLTFQTFDVEASSNDKDHCDSDVVAVYEDYTTETEHGTLIGEFCGSIIPPSIVSKKNKLTIVLRTDRSVKGIGFKATYESITNDENCNKVFTSPSGMIVYDGSENDNWVQCDYYIRLPRNKRILVKFNNFTIPCIDSTLFVRNGLGIDSPGFKGLYGISEVCSGHPISSLRTHSNFFFMRLVTNMPRKTKFSISYEQFNGGCGGKLSGLSGAISTPHFPEKDKHSYDCEWHIIGSLGNQIKFNIVAMDELSTQIDNGTSYCHGYMSNSIDIYEGYNKGYEKLMSYCYKSDQLNSVTSDGNDMIVKYRQNYHGTKDGVYGFLGEYYTNCQGILLSDHHGYIQNPGYGFEVNEHLSCNWRIDVGKGNRIRVKIIDFEVYEFSNHSKSNKCSDNWLKIGDHQLKFMENREDININSTFNDFCSDTNIINNFESVGQILDISYNTYNMPNNKFWIYYETIGCGGTINENNTIIMISNTTFPELFSNNDRIPFECRWRVSSPFGYNIKVNLEKILINRAEEELDSDCIYGLSYFSGPDNATGMPQRQYCSKSFDKIFISHSNEIFILINAKKGTYSFDKKDNIMFKALIEFIPSTFDDDCGGEAHLKVNEIIPFHTINYPKPYIKGIDCKWRFTSPPGYFVGYRLKTFNGGHMGTVKLPFAKKFNRYNLTECSNSNLRIFGFLFIKIYNHLSNEYNSFLTTCGQSEIKKPIYLNTLNNDSIVEFRGASLDLALISNEKNNKPVGLLMEAFTVCGGELVATKERKTYTFNSIHENNCSLIIMPEDKEGEMDVIKVKLTSIWLGTHKTMVDDKVTKFNFTCSTDTTSEPWVVSRGNYENRWYSFSCQGPIIVDIYNISNGSIDNMILQYGTNSHFCGGEITGNGLEEADSKSRDFECMYTYSNALGNNVEIQIENINIPWSENCIDGYFEVRKVNESGDVLGRFCGNDEDSSETDNRGIGKKFEGNKLWMRYKVKMKSLTGEDSELYTSIKFNKNAKIGGFVEGNVIESSSYMELNKVYTWYIMDQNIKGISLKIESLHIPNSEYSDIIECKSSKLCEGLTIMEGICEDDQDWETCGRILHNLHGFIADDRELILKGKEFTIGLYAKTKVSFRLSWAYLYTTTQLLNHTTIEIDTDFNCGGMLNPSFTTQTLKNPTVGDKSNYLPDQRCKWTIKRPLFRGIEIKLIFLDLESSLNCRYDYLYVTKNSYTKTSQIPFETETEKRICDMVPEDNSKIVLLDDSELNIYFVSDRSRQGRGFQIDYRLLCDSKEYFEADNGNFVGTLVSPMYPDPYPSNISCTWSISTDSLRRIEVTPNEIDLRVNDDGSCKNDILTLSGKVPGNGSMMGFLEFSKPLKYETCKKSFINITFAHGKLEVNFKSGPEPNNKKGFSLKINEIVDPCNDMHLVVDEDNPIKILHSPNWPNRSPNSLNCGWKISAPIGHRIKFNIDPENFNIEETLGDECLNDFLEIFDGPSKQNKLIGRYCRDKSPETIFSTSNYLFVHYKTDSMIQSHGFNGTYSIADCGGTIFLKPNTKYSLFSPRYPNYDQANHQCLWKIRAPKNYQILIDIKSLLISPKNNCSNGYVSIRDSYTDDENGYYILPPTCAKQFSKITPLKSKSHVIFVDYNITHLYSKPNSLLCSTGGCGFSFIFTLAKQDCGGIIDDNIGEIHSPGYPNTIIPGLKCEWIFKGGLDYRYYFKLEFLQNKHSYNLPVVDVLSNGFIEEKKCYDDIKIYNGFPPLDDYYNGPDTMFCINRDTFISTADLVTLKFEDDMKRKLGLYAYVDSKKSINTTSIKYPFKIKYRKIGKDSFSHGCLYTITNNTSLNIGPLDLISNQDYPSGGNSYCHINIKRPAGSYTTMLKFSNFTVGPINNRFCDLKNNYINLKPTSKDIMKFEYNLCSQYNKTKTNFNIAVALEEFDIFVYNNHRSKLGTTIFGQENTQFNLTVEFAKCGGIVKEMKGFITSPTYYSMDMDDSKKTFESCVWTLKAPENHIVKINIHNITLQSTSYQSSDAFLNIYEGDTEDNAVLHRFSEKEQTNMKEFYNIKSKGQIVIIQWYIGKLNQFKRGFKLQYEYLREDNECGYHIYGMNGTIISPGDDIYPNNLDCLWDISVPQGYLVKLTFKRFDVEESNDCKSDFLLISEYVEHMIEHRLTGFKVGEYKHHTFHKLCGNKKVPVPIVSTTNGLRLNFTTNEKNAGKGFEIYWEAVCGGLVEAASGEITSPYYPLYYPGGIECNYIISANKIRGSPGHGGGLILSVNVVDLSKEFMFMKDAYMPHVFNENNNSSSKCFSDSVEIFDLRTGKILRSICGYNYIENKNKIYNYDDVGVKFVSHSSSYDEDEKGMKHYKGFSINFVQNQCNINVTLDDDIDTQHEHSIYELFSPNYPKEYFPNMDCLINVTTSPGYIINAHIGDFHVESSERCRFDYVEFFDGTNMDNETSMGKLCGEFKDRKIIKSTNNSLLMKFKTDSSKHFKGYDITFTQSYGVDKKCGGVINVTDHPITIKAPVYEKYSSGYFFMDCLWQLETQKNKIIKITINELNLSKFKNGYVKGECEDHLNIYDGLIGSSSTIVKEICDFRNYPSQSEIILTSTNRIVNIQLQAHYINTKNKEMDIEVVSIDPECGGTLPASDTFSIFAYKDRQLPTRDNQRHVRCKWYVFSEGRTPLEIVFTNFNVPAITLDCSEEYLEIRDVGSLVECQHPACGDSEENKKVIKYCGSIKPSFFVSLSPVVQITLSTFRTSQYQANISFKYKSLGSCNRTITISEDEHTLSGRFTSPNYPNFYSHNSICITNFVLDEKIKNSHRILLVFDEVQLERGSSQLFLSTNLYNPFQNNFNSKLTYGISTIDSSYQSMSQCRYDALRIEDQIGNKTKTFCGNVIPSPYLSTGDTLRLNLTSDATTNARGYAGTYFGVRVIETETYTIYKFENNYDTEGVIANIGFPFTLNKTTKSVWSVIPPRGSKCSIDLLFLKLPINSDDKNCKKFINEYFSIIHVDAEVLNENSSLSSNAEMINFPCTFTGVQTFDLKEGKKFYIHYETKESPDKVTNKYEGFRLAWKCAKSNFVSKGYHGIRSKIHNY